MNRERVYIYYGDKTSLFSRVVNGELEGIANAVPLDVNGPADIAVFAGRTFDYQRGNPHLARLVLWEGLADRGAADQELLRASLYKNKAAAIAAAQQRGVIDDSVDPAAFVFLIISLSSYWLAAPQLARMLLGDNGADHSRRRAAVVTAAERIATPRTR